MSTFRDIDNRWLIVESYLSATDVTAAFSTFFGGIILAFLTCERGRLIKLKVIYISVVY